MHASIPGPTMKTTTLFPCSPLPSSPPPCLPSIPSVDCLSRHPPGLPRSRSPHGTPYNEGACACYWRPAPPR